MSTTQGNKRCSSIARGKKEKCKNPIYADSENTETDILRSSVTNNVYCISVCSMSYGPPGNHPIYYRQLTFDQSLIWDKLMINRKLPLQTGNGHHLNCLCTVLFSVRNKIVFTTGTWQFFLAVPSLCAFHCFIV